MTDNEIIKALKCCFRGNHCADYCPYDDEDDGIHGCTSALARDALDLINIQKAEIERLQKILVGFMDEVGTWSDKYDVDISTIFKLPFLAKEEFNIKNKIKSEAIKEFAERLKAMSEYGTINISPWQVDNLVKEMTEGRNESENTEGV